MVYKVLYQENSEEVPIRERTTSLYMEASSEREVRKKLSKRQLNIEYVQALEDKHLEYEKQSEDFKVENG